MRENVLTIGEMARRYGVSYRALRFYEDQGLICPVRDGVSRHYQPSDETRIQLVLKGKRLGFSVREIRELIGVATREDDTLPSSDLIHRIEAERIKEKLRELTHKRGQIQAAIDELQFAYRKAQ